MILRRNTVCVLLHVSLAVFPTTVECFHRAFVSHRVHVPAFSPRVGVPLKASETSVDEKQPKSRTVTLIFEGTTSYTTDAVPLPGSPTKMAEFFELEENRNFLLSGSGGNKVEPTETTDELIGRWQTEVAKSGAAAPVPSDKIVRVTTTGIKFPGLQIFSIATIGTKLIPPSDESAYPAYQFTLIRDEITAEGPPPLLWVFNKLTGASKEKSEKEQTSHSLTTVMVEPSAEDLTFKSNARLAVEVEFPALLLKILPVSKEKAEEQGSSSILKAVEKDVKPGLDNFRDAYDKWISSS